MRRSSLTLTVLAVLVATNSFGGVELVLVDERHLRGESVERSGDEFLLETVRGEKLVIPRQLVAQTWLTGVRRILCEHVGAGSRQEGQRPRSALDAFSEPGTAGTERHSPGYRLDPDRDLSDAPDALDDGGDSTAVIRGSSKFPPIGRTPTRVEQLAAFNRAPATFQRGTSSSAWRYEDVMGVRTDVSSFRPARWSPSPIDPVWSYEDVLGLESDVTRFSPVRWSRPSGVSWWYPRNGWMTENDGAR